MSEDAKNKESANKTLDRVYRLTGAGGYGTSKLDLHRGIDINSTGFPIETPREVNGYVFFPRPTLNLTTSNLLPHRKLHYLLNPDGMSMGALIRNLLYPPKWRVMVNTKDGAAVSPLYEIQESPLCDNRQPFIPMLTNTLRSLTGWPDKVVDFFTSAEGLAQEVYAYADGHREFFGAYDLTAVFDNKRGSPVESLITAWCYYMLAVFDGSMYALPEMRAKRRVDYQTRPYVFIMDETGAYVQKVACAGVAAWRASTEGSSFNIDKTVPIITDNNEISMQLYCQGALYNDPLIIEQFNNLVLMYNPSINDGQTYVKLDPVEYDMFKSMAIPFVDIEDGYRLNWYVPSDDYEAHVYQYGSLV